MFSFQPCDELVFSSPTTCCQELMDNSLSLLEGNLISFSATTKEEQLIQPPSNMGSRQGQKGQKQSSKCGSYNRRVLHRDIERKRREQMSKLYVSLRTLLPMDDHHNKGKSSVSDQMEEATKYIKQMHEKIEELRTQREKLKKLHNSSSSSSSSWGTNILENSDDLENCVAVQRVMDGLEILITNKIPQFELSHVLAQLSQTDLDVVTCVSTRTKGGFLHKIVTKASNRASIDVWELQGRLRDTIK